MVSLLRCKEARDLQATMTSKGQVTVPKPIRDKLRLRSGDKIEFTLVQDGSLLLAPVTAPVTRLKGMVPRPEASLDLDAIDQAVANAVARRRLP